MDRYSVIWRLAYFGVALLTVVGISATAYADYGVLPMEVTQQQAGGVIVHPTLRFTFGNHYDASTPISIDLAVTGATYGGNPSVTILEYVPDSANANVGSFAPVSTTGCDVAVSGTHLTIGAAGNCVAANGHNIAAFDISGLTYSSNNLLTSADHSIYLTLAVTMPPTSTLQPYDKHVVYTAVTIPGLTPSKYGISLSLKGNGYGDVKRDPIGSDPRSDNLYTAGTVVTLTAIPLDTGNALVANTFTGWSGACSGTDPTCKTTISGSTTVTASFGHTFYLRIGTVYSTSQSNTQSFLRFHNTGTAAGTVTLTLSDYTTGQTLGQWTSPSIPVNASPQYSMGTIESGLPQGLTKPRYYSITVQSNITGYMQHVVWRPNEGAFSNLSTCSNGEAAADSLNNVHSSAIDYGYPSTIVVNSYSTSPELVTLGVYGANDGAKLGTYTTALIPAGGQTFVRMATIEAALNIKPGSVGNHYVIKAEGSFIGFLQHLVENVQASILLDMTAVCALPSPSS